MVNVRGELFLVVVKQNAKELFIQINQKPKNKNTLKHSLKVIVG